MTDPSSIFDNNQNSGTNPNTPQPGNGGNSQNDQLTTLLAAIKNERGEPKYKTVEDALKALQHSQEYIPTLKQTKEELEARLQAVSAKADKVDQLTALVEQLTQTNKEPAANQPSSVLTEEQVADLVQKTLTKTQKEAVQKQNLETVITTMKTVFGDKASEVFYQRAQELGISREDFNAMAAKTPQAVLKLVGADNSSQNRNLPSNINTNGFQPKPDSAIGRNKAKSTLLGATTEELMQERQRSNALVEEMHAMGKSVHDLSDPKVYFKVFQ
jgi:hypothetical protein